MSAFDARSYWEGRLEADWSLASVGFRRMGRRFNDWAYRWRGERFAMIVEEFMADRSEARVLDVGSGTGFYIEAWRRLGVRDVVGMDFSQAAVANLRIAFPEVRFVQTDISDGIGATTPASFDVVSCMDVMFHIVDNRRFAAALANVARLLVPGGYFIWSDFFLHGREVVHEHIAWRSIYRIETVLDQIGLEVVDRRPMFFCMNEPRDTSSRIVLHGWRGLMWLAGTSEATGEIAGRLLYRLDRRMCVRHVESPSTEVMVCRKPLG